MLPNGGPFLRAGDENLLRTRCLRHWADASATGARAAAKLANGRSGSYPDYGITGLKGTTYRVEGRVGCDLPRLRSQRLPTGGLVSGLRRLFGTSEAESTPRGLLHLRVDRSGSGAVLRAGLAGVRPAAARLADGFAGSSLLVGFRLCDVLLVAWAYRAPASGRGDPTDVRGPRRVRITNRRERTDLRHAGRRASFAGHA